MKPVAFATLTTLTAVAAYANPLNPTVVGGSATVVQSGSTLTVNQTSQRAAIDWQSFNIAAGETTRFVQQSSSAVVLNRVWGPGASTIAGNLLANGHVIVVNPSGIVFTPTSFVNVAGLVATTSNITNANFMAGNMVFDQPGNPRASVVNEGSISVADGGLAAFVAPGVRNAGTIEARLGKVSLASGSKFTVDLYGDGLVNLALDAATANELGKVEHTGRIAADGGTILMSVAAAKGVVDGLLNVSGVVQARRAEMRDGKIVLRGTNTAVYLAGAFNGGSIEIFADSIAATSDALVQGTGSITIGPPSPIETKAIVLDGGGTLSTGSVSIGSTSAVTITTSASSGSSGTVSVTGVKYDTTDLSGGSTFAVTVTSSPPATTVTPPVTTAPPSITTAPPPVTAGNVQVVTPPAPAPVPPLARDSDQLLAVNTGIFAGVTVAHSMSSAPMTQPPTSAAALSFTQSAIDPFAAPLRVVETGPQSGAFRDLPYFRDGLWTGGGH